MYRNRHDNGRLTTSVRQSVLTIWFADKDFNEFFDSQKLQSCSTWRYYWRKRIINVLVGALTSRNKNSSVCADRNKIQTDFDKTNCRDGRLNQFFLRKYGKKNSSGFPACTGCYRPCSFWPENQRRSGGSCFKINVLKMCRCGITIF